MEFLGDKGNVITIKGKSSEARNFYLESLKIIRASPESEKGAKSDSKGKRDMERRDLPSDSRVMMINLDPRADFEHRSAQPKSNQVKIQVGKSES